MKIAQSIIIGVALLGLEACSRARSFDLKKVEGEYYCIYQSGHVEVLHMDADLSYTQELYPTIDAYENDTARILRNEGFYNYHEREFTFRNWARMCPGSGPYAPDLPPDIVTFANVYWVASNGEYEGLLVFREEPWYVFRRNP